MLVAHWSSRCPGTSCSVQRTHARPLHLAVAPRGIKSAAASTAAVRQQLQGSHGSSRHRGILLVVRVAKSEWVGVVQCLLGMTAAAAW
jgi:hypothetical protein